MKRKDFIRSLLGLAAAPTVLKNIEAKPEPKIELTEVKCLTTGELAINRPVERVTVKDAPGLVIGKPVKIYVGGEEVTCGTPMPIYRVGKTFTAKGNKITFK